MTAVKLKTFCRRIKPSLRATPTIKGAGQGVNATIVPGSAEKRVEHAALMLVGLLSEPTDPFKKKSAKSGRTATDGTESPRNCGRWGGLHHRAA